MSDSIADAGFTLESLDFDRFESLQGPWDELVESSVSPSPFLTHRFLSTWWRHFGDGADFRAFVLRDRAGRLVAAAPIAVRKAKLLGRSIRVAELVGTAPVPSRGMGLADRADLVFRVGSEPHHSGFVAGLLEALPSCDAVHLRGLDSDSSWLRLLTERSSIVLPRSTSPYLPLPEDWESYRMSRSRKFRKNLKRYGKRLEQLGEPRFERYEAGNSFDGWLDAVIDVNRESWKAERGTDLFRQPEIREFLVDLFTGMARDGRIELLVLRLDDRAIAYELGFDFADTIFGYNASYRTSFAEHSPGTLTTAAVIRSACERGRREYDMLRGAEGYKSRFSSTVRRECEWVLPRTLGGRVYARLAVRLKARLKSVPLIEKLADRWAGSRARRSDE